MSQVARFEHLTKLFRECNRTHLQDFVDGTLMSPLLVELDPTTACNYSCEECISRELLNHQQIPTPRLLELIRELGRMGAQGIIFIGGGEPLIHPAMPKPLALAHELGLAVGLTTNGSLIHRHERAIAECVDWTRVSVDAATSGTYRHFRPHKSGHGFEEVLRAMESLATVKQGSLGFSFLILQRPSQGQESATFHASDGREYRTNAHEIAAAARLAKEVGCDYFEYKPMVDQRHHLVPFPPVLQEIVREQARLSAELIDDTFEIVVPRSIGFLFGNDDPVEAKEYSRCPAMELRTLITPAGVFPCPYHRGRHDKRLGLIDDLPFDEFWASNIRRAAMKLVDPRRDCRFYCIRHQVNVALDSIRKMHEADVPILDHIASRSVADPFF